MLLEEDFSNSWIDRSKSEAPVPQFAPKAIGLLGMEDIKPIPSHCKAILDLNTNP